MYLPLEFPAYILVFFSNQSTDNSVSCWQSLRGPTAPQASAAKGRVRKHRGPGPDTWLISATGLTSQPEKCKDWRGMSSFTSAITTATNRQPRDWPGEGFPSLPKTLKDLHFTLSQVMDLFKRCWQRVWTGPWGPPSPNHTSAHSCPYICAREILEALNEKRQPTPLTFSRDKRF